MLCLLLIFDCCHFVNMWINRHELPITVEPIEILAETSELLVVNKPSSIPIHPCGRYHFNSVTYILAKEHGFRNLRGIILKHYMSIWGPYLIMFFYLGMSTGQSAWRMNHLVICFVVWPTIDIWLCLFLSFCCFVSYVATHTDCHYIT